MASNGGKDVASRHLAIQGVHGVFMMAAVLTNLFFSVQMYWYYQFWSPASPEEPFYKDMTLLEYRREICENNKPEHANKPRGAFVSDEVFWPLPPGACIPHFG